MLITVRHQVVHSLDAEAMAALTAAIASNGESKSMLAETLAGIKQLLKKETIIMKEIDDLTAQVEANNTVIGSAKVAINGISAQITKAVEDFKAANPGVDATALTSLSASLKASDDELSAAIAANTPAAVA